jgi:hypothetical protein
MMGVLVVQHDRPAVSQVELHHVPSSVAENLEPNGFFQAIGMQIIHQFFDKTGADIREIIHPALSILVSHKVVSGGKFKDMTVHRCKINLLYGNWFRPTTGRFCQSVAQHHAAGSDFGMAMNEMDTKPTVHIVLDEDSGKALEMFGRHFRLSSSLSTREFWQIQQQPWFLQILCLLDGADRVSADEGQKLLGKSMISRFEEVLARWLLQSDENRKLHNIKYFKIFTRTCDKMNSEG